MRYGKKSDVRVHTQAYVCSMYCTYNGDCVVQPCSSHCLAAAVWFFSALQMFFIIDVWLTFWNGFFPFFFIAFHVLFGPFTSILSLSHSLCEQHSKIQNSNGNEIQQNGCGKERQGEREKNAHRSVFLTNIHFRLNEFHILKPVHHTNSFSIPCACALGRLCDCAGACVHVWWVCWSLVCLCERTRSFSIHMP